MNYTDVWKTVNTPKKARKCNDGETVSVYNMGTTTKD